MRKKIFQTILLLTLLPLSVFAQLEVSITGTEQTGNKSLIKLELNNTYAQDLKGARAWVFLMDAEGKVVGNKAQWIVGGDKNKPALEPSKKTTYTLALDTLRAQQPDEEPFKAKVTFSRLILADGTLLNPQKAVVTPKKD